MRHIVLNAVSDLTLLSFFPADPDTTLILSFAASSQALRSVDFARKTTANGEQLHTLSHSQCMQQLTIHPSLHPITSDFHSICLPTDLTSPICDSYVRPATLVRICEECNFGSSGGKCIICGGQGVSVSSSSLLPAVLASPLYKDSALTSLLPLLLLQDAYYCAECTRLEKDRDGCPKVVNLGASRTDLAYLRKARNQQQQ